MKNLIEELRACAKMHPLDIDLDVLLEAADVIETQTLIIQRLESAIPRLQEEIYQLKNGAVLPQGYKIERGFDVLDKTFRFVDDKSHLPTVKIILPACSPEDTEAFDTRDKVANSILGILGDDL